MYFKWAVGADSMMTRIDRLLGTEIFESIQDSVPRNIDIMVGMAHTSGRLVTGKRRYETCKACRELINPCFLNRAYACRGCRLPPSQLCTAETGNRLCQKSDKDAGDEARRTNMTVLYRCHFGLANYAIAARIGEMGSIILYGGQFHIGQPGEHEVLFEEFNENGRRTRIFDHDFRDLVATIDEWRCSLPKNNSPHLPFQERDKLLEDYLASPNPKQNIAVVIGENQKGSLDLRSLENILRRRYNLSLFEPWREFLKPPTDTQVALNRRDLNSYHISLNPAVRDRELINSASDALEAYDNWMNEFLNHPDAPTLDAEYKKAVVPLSKVFSTIEFLRNLAILISRTADVIFYKDTYLRLKSLWDSHPISIVESFDEKWRESASQLQQLRTIGREMVQLVPGPPEIESKKHEMDTSSHPILVKKLNRSLMLFAYKLLFEDFNAVISMLRYNYDIAKEYEKKEPEAMSKLIAETELCHMNIVTASCLFIRDLLEAKYEQLAKDSIQHAITNPKTKEEYSQTPKELNRIYNDIKIISSDAVERISNRLERYFNSKSTELPDLLDSGEDKNEMITWKDHIFSLLGRTSRQKWIKGGEDWIKQDDMMLRFLGLVFEGYEKTRSAEEHGVSTQDDPIKENLSTIGANLRWADAEIRGELEHVPTGVLQFDICQSMLRFVQKLREFVYSSRFNALEKLSAGASKNGFEREFMDPQRMTCKYFIDHGVNHIRKVLDNVKILIDVAQHNASMAKLSTGVTVKTFETAAKSNEKKGQEESEENFKNVCELPIWQYYVKCAALFHDVGMFSQQWHEELYGGPAAVRRCHGAFSGKRIVRERRFDIIGGDLDKRLVAQICTFHQGTVEIGSLHRNIRPLAAILRIADEFHVGEDRMCSVDLTARNDQLSIEIDGLRSDLEGLDLPKSEASDLTIPEIAVGTATADLRKQEDDIRFQVKKIKMIEERILALAEKRQERNGRRIWPADAPCFELVYKHPKFEAKLATFFSILRRCGEIRTLLEAPLHYQKHLSIQNVNVEVAPGGNFLIGKWLAPVITPATSLSHQGMLVPVSDQPWIIAERVKAKFRRELDTVREYLEPVGIRFKKLRMSKNSGSRNLLFINSPSNLKEKFIGAPTSLLYAISEVSLLVDSDPSYMDVNIDVWDPRQFTKDESDELRHLLLELKPRMVGISNTSAGHSNAIAIAKVIRKEKPDTIIIFGGAHENVSFFETMKLSSMGENDYFADISIGGIEEQIDIASLKNAKNNGESCANITYCADGEHILRVIVEDVLGKKLSRKDLPAFLESLNYGQQQGIFSIAFIDNHGRTVRKDCTNKLDVNNLPFLPRHLLDDSQKYDYEIFKEDITGKGRKTAQVITTRGCIHRCVFCSSVGKSARRTVDNVMKELRELKREGYRAIFFDDSTFADGCGNEPGDGQNCLCPYTSNLCPKVATEEQLNQEAAKSRKDKKHLPLYVHGRCGYAMKLCDAMFVEDMGYVWGCQTRADVIFDNALLLDAMKKAGCTYVYFGVESLKANILKGMCKEITPEKMMDGITQTRNKGMNVGLSLVFGLEGEDENSIHQTIECVTKLLEPVEDPGSRVSCVSINVATIYPGTRLHERVMGKAPNQIPNFDDPPRFNRYPYNEFEDGGRNLLPCTILRGNNEETESDLLARLALKECRKVFGKSLV